MRENMGLYRGKEKPSGKWVEGFLVDAKHIGNWVEAHPVDPETVGQFTGMTDKNGKKIFEGDIITVGETRLTWLIAFDGATFYATDNDERQQVCFALFEQYSFDRKAKKWMPPDNFEIVGNIHDNPELLPVLPEVSK